MTADTATSGPPRASGQQPMGVDDLARYVLARHRTAIRLGTVPRSGTSAAGRTPQRLRARDPQPLARAYDTIAEEHGWATDVAVWSLTQDWARLVGPQIAEHVVVTQFRADDPGAVPAEAVRHRAPAARQESLLEADAVRRPGAEAAPRQGGLLVLQADSDAWVAHVTYLLSDLYALLDRELGAGVVGRIRVVGPTAPRNPGPRRVARQRRT